MLFSTKIVAKYRWNTGVCPGIRKRGAQNLKAFFFAFQFFRGGGPAQKLAEKMILSTKKVAKYRWNTGVCPGIRKRGPKIWKPFFFAFQFFRGGGPAQKLAEKMIFSTKKVAKYRWNRLIFALKTFYFFLLFNF